MTFVALVNGFADGCVSRLWQTTWQGCLVALVVWTICRSKAISARVRLWLWWAVSLRMLIGLLPASEIPLPVLPVQPRTAPNSNIAPLVSDLVQAGGRSPRVEVRPLSTTVMTPLESSEDAKVAGQRHAITPAVWILAAWLLGALIFFLRIIGQGLGARRLILEATPVEESSIADLFKQLLDTARVHRKVALLQHPRVSGPILVGALRPSVLLPAGVSSSFTSEELRLGLSHEVIHIRRHDLLFSFVPYIVRALFFFHPLAWLAVREHSLALEASCDRDALTLTGGPVSEYGRLLLRLAATADHRTTAALGAASNYRVLERRLRMLQFPSSSGRTATITLIMAIAAATGIFIPWRLEAQRSHSSAATPAQEADQAVVLTTAQSRPTRKAKNAQPVRVTGSRATTAIISSPSLTPATVISRPASVTATPVPTAAIASTLSTPAAVATPTGRQTTVASVPTTPIVRASPLRTSGVAQELTSVSPVASVQTTGTAVLSAPLTPAGQTRLSGKVGAQGLTAAVPSGRSATTLGTGLTPGLSGTASRSLQVTSPATGVLAAPRNGQSLSVGTLAQANPTAPAALAGRKEQDVLVPHAVFDNMGLLMSLKLLFNCTQVDYTIAPGELGDALVSGEFKEAPLNQAVMSLLDQLSLKGKLDSQTLRGIRIVSPIADDLSADRVSLRLDGRDLRDALKALFTATHVNYTISADLRGSTVTASLDNKGVRAVLETLLRTASPPTSATYRIEGGVYHIVPRK